jgi:hypothetical protein
MSVVSPKQYIQIIHSHSETKSSNSLYQGSAFKGLYGFLEKSDGVDTPLAPPNGSVIHNFPFASLYYLPAESLEPRPLCPIEIAHPSLLTKNTQQRFQDNSLLFLRGYPSKEWLSTIGSHYNVDPEFFHRHLSFLSDGMPHKSTQKITLPSSQRTIFQLTLTSFGYQRGDTRESLERQRRAAASRMKEYIQGLCSGSMWNTGHSIVRSYERHTKELFSIEQQVSIYVGVRSPDKWNSK